MLVPALAFAWWRVALPNAPPEISEARARRRTPLAEATPEKADETGHNEDALDGVPEAEEAKGERVALKVVTPSIVQAARSFLDLPMGAARYLTLEGRRYVFVLERHYHPPGFVGAPNGWHKGVTAYAVR